DLRKPVHIRFARAEIAAFDGVVKQPVNAVAVVLIILRGVNAALRRDAVRAPGAVLKTEAFNVVTEFCKRCGSRCTGKPRSDKISRMNRAGCEVQQMNDYECPDHRPAE